MEEDKLIDQIDYCVNNGVCKKCKLHNYFFCKRKLLADALERIRNTPRVVRCRDCRMDGECSVQFKFADPDSPGDWFCGNGRPKDK